jgi:hypothetical protein
MGTRHHVNQGAIELPACHYCSSPIEGERAAANTPSGPRYFCKADPEQLHNSCYLQYRKRFN